jgi:hypothetical protein
LVGLNRAPGVRPPLRESAYHRELRVPVGGKHSLLAYAQVHGAELVVMLGRTGTKFRCD